MRMVAGEHMPVLLFGMVGMKIDAYACCEGEMMREWMQVEMEGGGCMLCYEGCRGLSGNPVSTVPETIAMSFVT